MNRTLLLLLALLGPLAVGCPTDAPPDDDDAANDDDDAADDDDASGDCWAGDSSGALAPDLFDAAALGAAITEETCTLSNGDTATCLRITLSGLPANHDIGPFCPRATSDGPDAGGIWIDGGEAHDLDGAFILGLADFYGDANWQLYDAISGEVHVTDSQEGCEAAARPNVDPAWQNHCVECDLSYIAGGTVETTYVIPKIPVPAATPNAITGDVAASLAGVPWAAPAPVDAILGAYTIAAFDDCGGHINPAAGYHVHTGGDCSARQTCDDHAPLLALALDGYGVYAMAGDDGQEPADLDSCRGHTDTVRGYHYHSAGVGENMFIGCFHGEIVGGGGGPGGGVIACEDVPPGMPCCGDTICDGPETPANCPADCQ